MIHKQIPIGETFPINLVLLPAYNAIAFITVAAFPAIYEMSEDGTVDALFTMEGFTIKDNTYNYNTMYTYKEMPELLGWLQKQNLTLN